MSGKGSGCGLCLSQYDRGQRERANDVLKWALNILCFMLVITLLSFVIPGSKRATQMFWVFTSFGVIAGSFFWKYLWHQDIYLFVADGQIHYHSEKYAPKYVGGKWYQDYGTCGGLVPVEGKIIRLRANLHNDGGSEILNPDKDVSGAVASWCMILCRTADPKATCTLLDTAGYGLIIPISHVLPTINSTKDMLEFGSRYTTYTDYLGEAIGESIAIAKNSKGTQRSQVAAAMRRPLENVLRLFPDRQNQWLEYGRIALGNSQVDATHFEEQVRSAIGANQIPRPTHSTDSSS